MLLSVVKASSQQPNVDSLVNILNTKELTYEEKSKLYSNICDIYLYSDMDKSFEYAKIALNLAEKEKHLKSQSLFNEFLGKIYCNRSVIDSAQYYLDKALVLAQKSNSKEQEGSVNICFGVFYNQQSNFEKSLEHYMKALVIYESLNHKINVIIILGNIASVQRTLNNIDRALYYLKKSEEVLNETKESDYPIGWMNTYYQLAAVYAEKGDMEKQQEYIVKVLTTARKYGNLNFEIGALHALSLISLTKKDFEDALKYGKETLALSEKLGHKSLIMGAWCGLSDIYGTMDMWKECESAAFQALEIDSTDIHHNKTLLYNIIWSNIYLGNKEKASTFLEKYETYWVQNNEKSLHESLANMEIKYETEKKEIRIASLEKERQMYIWLGFAGILLAIAFAIMLRQKIKNTRKEKQLIATRSVLDGEMGERTRLARDLHDRLSGNLSAVKIGLNDNKESLQNVYDKLDNCIEEIRRAAHDLMPISLQFGMKIALQDFAAQFSNVHFHFFGEEKRIEERVEFVVYCCANELVNNSLRHSDAKNINLQLIQNEKHITLTVHDDGCGFDEKSVKRGSGLKNTQDRVTSCNGKIDIITSPGKGTEITIELKTENNSWK